MKKCNVCGTTLDNQTLYCTTCGSKADYSSEQSQGSQTPTTYPQHPMQQSHSYGRSQQQSSYGYSYQQSGSQAASQPKAETTKSEQKPAKKSRLTIILMCICIVLAVAVIVESIVLVSTLSTTEQRILSAMENGHYDKVVELMNEQNPVSLSNLRPNSYDGNWDVPCTIFQDAKGRSYPDTFNAFIPFQDGYGEYYINGKYTRITGRVATWHHFDKYQLNHLQIYADNELIYESEEININSDVIFFDVTLPEGTDFIKIVNTANEWGYSEILIMDVMLWP